MTWLIYSGISMFLSISFILLIKFTSSKISASEMWFPVFFIAGILYYLNSLISTKRVFNPELLNYIPHLIAMGILSFIINLFTVKAIQIAPNPSYATTIVDLRVVGVAVLSVFLFKSDLSLKGMLGILLCVCGGVLIGLK